MKSNILVMVGACFFFSQVALAKSGVETKRRVLKDVTVDTVLALNRETVRCSAVGYGLEELKVSVPDLDYVAFFDHANRGELVPCMTAGRTFEGCTVLPHLVDETKPTETSKLRVVLTEIYEIDHEKNTCARRLEEVASMDVRGTAFQHYRAGHLGNLPYAECVFTPSW